MTNRLSRIWRFAAVLLGGIMLLSFGYYGVSAQGDLPPPPRPKPTALPDPNERPVPSSGSGTSSSKTVPRLFVVLEATPNIWVQRGDTITYHARIKNIGGLAATNASFYMPYDSTQMAIIGNQADEGISINSSSNNYVLVTAQNLQPEEERTFSLQAMVAETVPDGSVITAKVSFHQRGKSLSMPSSSNKPVPLQQGDAAIVPVTEVDTSMMITSNTVPVLVGDANVSSPFVWMEARSIQGQEGTIYHFFSDRFVPNEEVVTWLNTPSGDVQELDMVSESNGSGQVWFQLSDKDYVPGTYQLVAYGIDSNLRAVATFVVE